MIRWLLEQHWSFYVGVVLFAIPVVALIYLLLDTTKGAFGPYNPW